MLGLNRSDCFAPHEGVYKNTKPPFGTGQGIEVGFINDRLKYIALYQ